MKKILSEKNVVVILFLVVFIAFAFAHEDSKKRYSNYNSSFPSVSPVNSSVQLLNNKEMPASGSALTSPLIRD